jgi:DNA primase
MNILDLAKEVGLQPRKVGFTNGGEYKSACPNCKTGSDRFCIWPHQGVTGKYWCRQCSCRGDAIQFCRDFLHLTYSAACAKINIKVKNNFSPVKGYFPFSRFSFVPKGSQDVLEKWKIRAQNFIGECHRRLLDNHESMQFLLARGLTLETIKKFSLGWNPETIFDNRVEWGMPREIKENGQERKQWLPKGIIIPIFEHGIPICIKVRRTDWQSGDQWPKYVEISGSTQRPSIYGDMDKPVIVLESELDAILIQQFASDLCCCCALGGVSKRPDSRVHTLLEHSPLILLSLDYDEPGRAAYLFWMRLYPHLKSWPPNKGKSPGDAFQLGSDLRSWVASGLSTRF